MLMFNSTLDNLFKELASTANEHFGEVQGKAKEAVNLAKDKLTNTITAPYAILDNSIKINLAGTRKEDISIEATSTTLVVKATRTNIVNKTEKIENLFDFNVEVDDASISSAYVDGILTVSVPSKKKKEEAKTRKVEIW